MITKGNVWHKPQVTIHNEAITIRDDTHGLKLGLEEVSKMFLSKNKTAVSSLLRLLWFHPQVSYNLHIQTKNAEEIKIRIKDFQRQYYINLISRVRKNIV